MKARELAQFLLLNPDADVRLYSPLVGYAPYIMEPTDITMNNEANAYVIEPLPRFTPSSDPRVSQPGVNQGGPGVPGAALEAARALAPDDAG